MLEIDDLPNVLANPLRKIVKIVLPPWWNKPLGELEGGKEASFSRLSFISRGHLTLVLLHFWNLAAPRSLSPRVSYFPRTVAQLSNLLERCSDVLSLFPGIGFDLRPSFLIAVRSRLELFGCQQVPISIAVALVVNGYVNCWIYRSFCVKAVSIDRFCDCQFTNLS